MFSSAHHGVKKGLQIYTSQKILDAFETLQQKYQGRAKRDGTESVIASYRLLHESSKPTN